MLENIQHGRSLDVDRIPVISSMWILQEEQVKLRALGLVVVGFPLSVAGATDLSVATLTRWNTLAFRTACPTSSHTHVRPAMQLAPYPTSWLAVYWWSWSALWWGWSNYWSGRSEQWWGGSNHWWGRSVQWWGRRTYFGGLLHNLAVDCHASLQLETSEQQTIKQCTAYFKDKVEEQLSSFVFVAKWLWIYDKGIG